MEPIDNELSMEERIMDDFYEIAEKYMKLVPGSSFDQEDYLDVSIELLYFFEESIGRAQNGTLLTGLEKMS